MQDEPGDSEAELQPATLLLRQILQVQGVFEHGLRSRLTVNATDLAAMEFLIMSGPSSPSVLANALGLTTAGVTTVIDRLAAVGHVTREPHPTDRRGVRVIPNPKSVDTALGVILPMISDVDAVLTRFEPDEQRVITEYLEGVSAAYSAHAESARRPAAGA